MINSVIFDLDGTLVDSAEDIIDCLEKAYTEAEVASYIGRLDKSIIGPPLRELIRQATPELHDEKMEYIVKQFRKYYDASPLDKTRLKNGARNALCHLTALDKKMILVTNKPMQPTRKILANLNLNYFEDVVTPDVHSGRTLDK